MAFSPVFQRPFSATFDRRAAAAAAGNGLRNALIAYWPGNEAAGANDALDAHSGGLTLTQANSPGADTGKVYSTARTFAPASTQYFNRAVSASVQPADQMAFAVWIYLASTASPRRPILALQGAVDTPYVLSVNSLSNIDWTLFAGGTNYGQLVSTAKISVNTWTLIIAEFDRPTLRLTVNTTAKTATWDYSATTGTGSFNLGRETVARYWDGRIGPVAFWKNRTLSADDRTALYNAGAGLAYAQFTT